MHGFLDVVFIWRSLLFSTTVIVILLTPLPFPVIDIAPPQIYVRHYLMSYLLSDVRTSRHTVVCRVAKKAGAPHCEYIYRKKENSCFMHA